MLTSVLYEVFPMSFLLEQAGGQAFTGKERVYLLTDIAYCLYWLKLLINLFVLYAKRSIARNSSAIFLHCYWSFMETKYNYDMWFIETFS